jgi:iron complex outermembrane receptor protein
MKRLPIALLTLAALAAPAVAGAQAAKPPGELAELNIEQLMNVEVDRVYGASKFLQDVTRAPASVTVVKASEIEAYGFRTLADVLAAVPGFYTTYDRNYTRIGTRGFGRPSDYNSRVLILVDGHRVNDNVYEAGMAGTEDIVDLALVDRIEVIRGPSSTLYGTSAFFAVVNIITRSPASLRGVEVEATAGALGTFQGRLTYGKAFTNGVELALSASAYGSQQQAYLYFPELDSPETNNGVSENADDDRYQRAFARVTFKNLAIQAVHMSREKIVPTGAFGTTLSDPDNRTTDAHQFIDALYAGEVGNGTKLVGRVFYDRNRYTGNYAYAAGDTTELQTDSSKGDWLGTEALLTREVASRHTVSAGMEYRWNVRQDQVTYFNSADDALLDDRRSSSNWALYAQDEFRIHKMFTANLGIRHDHYSEFGGTTHFRFGGIVQPTASTTFKVLHGSAFRAPSMYETYYTLQPDPNILEPETITTDEGIWEQFYGKHLRSSVSVFWYRIENLIDQVGVIDDPLASPVYANLGRVNASGMEASIEATINRFSVSVAQTGQFAADAATDEALTNMPEHVTKIGARASLLDNRVVVGFQGQYLGSRYTLARDIVPAYFRQSLTLTVRPGLEGLSLSAGIDNLSGARYWDPVGAEFTQDRLEQNGRTAWMKVNWRF